MESHSNSMVHHLVARPHPPTWNPNMCQGREHGVLTRIMRDCHGACPRALTRKPPLCRFCGPIRQLGFLLSRLPALHMAIRASRLTLPILPSVRYVWQGCILMLFLRFDFSPGLLFQLSQLPGSCLMVAKKVSVSSGALPVPTIQKGQAVPG